MKPKLLVKYLQCPYCQGKLRLRTKTITCLKCADDFKVIEGVPVLLKQGVLGQQEKDQKKWFENHYAQFSAEKYQLENWRLSVLKRALETNFSGKVKTYLDIGCGATGYTVIEAAKRNKWLSFGMDISLEAMIRANGLAKKEGVGDKTAFLACSAEKMPFRAGLFDYVSILSVLEHLKNDDQVLKDIARIVKSRGYLYVCVPNTYRRMWPFLWPIYFYLDKMIGHQRHYSIEGLKRQAKSAGFKLDRVFYNAHLIKLISLSLEKMKLISDQMWWRLEKKDINQNPMGIQLNAIFKKIL